jgi:hypothetical protein
MPPSIGMEYSSSSILRERFWNIACHTRKHKQTKTKKEARLVRRSRGGRGEKGKEKREERREKREERRERDRVGTYDCEFISLSDVENVCVHINFHVNIEMVTLANDSGHC